MLEEDNHDLRNQLYDIKRLHQDSETELGRIREERRRDQEEAARVRASSLSRVKEKDVEIERLRNQVFYILLQLFLEKLSFHFGVTTGALRQRGQFTGHY